MEDICIMLDGYKFNYRVAAIIKKDNKVLLHKSKKDDFYAIPGGRVKAGEPSVDTLKREFKEEIGRDINIKSFAGIVENFFEYNGKKYDELMILFEAEFIDYNLYEVEKITGLEENGKIEFVWKNLNELNNLDVKPVFLKEKLIKNEKIGHILNYKLKC